MDPNTLVQNATNVTASEVDVTPVGLFLSSVALFLMALGPIFFGSLSSREVQKDEEVVSSRDAAVFPIFASAALFGIYLLFKFVPTQYIHLLVDIHFSLIGAGVIASLVSPLLRFLVPKPIKNDLYKLEFSKSAVTDECESGWKVVDSTSIGVETRDLPGVVVGVAVGVWYFVTRHWIANNFVAYSLAVSAIKLIKLNKFVNACLLLGGLFFYDIFWVFGTPVMVSVARSLEAPIKVSFPRDFLVHGVFGKQFAILGLGDIVVPGIFIAMLLRFDASLNRKNSRLYFFTGYIAYVIGLVTTFIVMHVFKAAQPALLYLVPACLGSTLFLAWTKGDLKAMFEYTDVPKPKADLDGESSKKSDTEVKDMSQSIPSLTTPKETKKVK